MLPTPESRPVSVHQHSHSEFGSNAIRQPIRTVLDATAFIVASIPALVLLFWFYYPAQTLAGIVVSGFWTAIVALSVINILAVYRIVAESLRDVPEQFSRSALVCGMSARSIWLRIRLPLAARAAAARWIDQQVVILQTSVFASLIGVSEIFRVAQRINAHEYRPVAVYSAMALSFLLVAGMPLLLSAWLQRRFRRDFSET